MLSILIPIYQKDITKLVSNLVKQCHKAKIAFEVICLDDLSSPKIRTANQPLNQMMGVNYVELSENKGRARIRNQLAKLARYDHLLFLDCDTRLKGAKFIKNYLPYLKARGAVIGGREYNKKPPKSKKKLLHWTYGNKRESRSVKHRNKNKVAFFHSNNFVIDRQSILDHPFDVDIQGYGYEDLCLGYLLHQNGIKITHIDNPTIHAGLENADVFLRKAEEASQNLSRLFQMGLVPDTRLIKAYQFLAKNRLKGWFCKWMVKRIDRYLHKFSTGEFRLYWLDLLKLYWFCEGVEE